MLLVNVWIWWMNEFFRSFFFFFFFFQVVITNLKPWNGNGSIVLFLVSCLPSLPRSPAAYHGNAHQANHQGQQKTEVHRCVWLVPLTLPRPGEAIRVLVVQVSIISGETEKEKKKKKNTWNGSGMAKKENDLERLFLTPLLAPTSNKYPLD